MGYRSDVVLMAVLSSSEHCDEVLAAYRMLPIVQSNNLEADWRRVNRETGVTVLIYEGRDVKWYETYEDVQGMYALKTLLESFFEERGLSFAWGEARIGEEDADVHSETDHSNDDAGDNLREVIWDNLRIVREVHVDL
jgi:hypothetical protein